MGENDAGVNEMWLRWNVKQRVMRSVILLSALLVFSVANTWMEVQSEQRRQDQISRLIEDVRGIVGGLPENALTTDLRALQEEEALREMRSLDVRYIPGLLRAIGREEERVALVVAAVVTDIGMLPISPHDWSGAEEWKVLWNGLVRQAQREVPRILADASLSERDMEDRLIEYGVSAVPVLLDNWDLVRKSEAGRNVVRKLLGRASHVPRTDDQASWRLWFSRYAGDYEHLRYLFQ